MSRSLIIFSRYPEPGKTKTRMIPALGEQGAAQLQGQMTEYTLNQAQKLAALLPVEVEVHFNGGSQELMEAWLGEDCLYYPQVPGDLGVKLTAACQQAFSAGKTQVIAIGIDCPSVTPQLLTRAFQELEQQDLILGPAEDGGYYLIGMSRFLPQIFQQIPWGTSQVFSETLGIVEQLQLEVAHLPTLKDVDRPEDLPLWQKYFSSSDLG